MGQRNELVELARSGSVEGSTQMKGKKKKDATCKGQLIEKFGGTDVKILEACDTMGFLGFHFSSRAPVNNITSLVDLQKDCDACATEEDVEEYCSGPCHKYLDDWKHLESLTEINDPKDPY